MFLRSFIFITLLLSFSNSIAQTLLEPGDNEYWVYEKNGFRYILTLDHLEYLSPLTQFAEEMRPHYNTHFNWQLDEMATITLASSKNQITNALAMSAPHIKTILYPGGISSADYFAETNWLFNTFNHEYTHLYQTNVKHGFSAFIKKYLGNINDFFLWTFITQPNQFLPRYFTEGNAVLNESLNQQGGRLHSGPIRANVYKLILSGKVTPNWLINNRYDYPYLRVPYNVGGYFWLFLAENYGLEKTNQLFYAQATHYINPYIINSTFRHHFGKSLYELIDEFVFTYREKAEKLNSLNNGEILARGQSYFPLNRQADSIYTLSYDNVGSPKRISLNTKNNEVEIKKTMVLPEFAAKTFKLNDQFYAVNTMSVETDDGLQEVRGLYDRNGDLYTPSFSKHVCDIQENLILYIPVGKQWIHPKLVLETVDGKKIKEISDANSCGLIGQNNDIYYFKQQSHTRTFFKNDHAVFSYDGYFGTLVDVQNNDIYFIANTETGSSLYKWKSGQIYQVLPFDDIADAKILKNNKVLLWQVTESGFNLVRTELQTPEIKNPHKDNFKVEKKKFVQLNQFKQSEIKRSDLKPYSAMREMRYVYLSPYIGEQITGTEDNQKSHLVGSMHLNFSDPLLFNQLDLFYDQGTFESKKATVIYSNNKYRLGWGFGFQYDEDVYTYNNEVTDRIPSRQGFLSLNFPWYTNGRIANKLSLDLTHDEYDQKKEFYSTLLYQRSYGFNRGIKIAPEKSYNWTVGTRKYEDGDLYRIDADFGRDLYRHTIATLSFGGGMANQNYFRLSSNQTSLYDIEKNRSPTIDVTYPASDFYYAKLKLQQGINAKWYSRWFPIGISRLFPFVQLQHNSFRQKILGKKRDQFSYTEWTKGVEIELLLAHEVDLVVSIEGGENDIKGSSSNFTAMLSYQKGF